MLAALGYILLGMLLGAAALVAIFVALIANALRKDKFFR